MAILAGFAEHRPSKDYGAWKGWARLRRAKEQSGRRGRGWAVTKETALLDDLHHFRRHHFLPTAVTGLQFGERVRRENLEVLRMIIGDFGDEIVIHDELEKRLQVGSDRDLTGRNDFAASFVDHWINVEFKRTLEHPP